jgi:hypothetical protein
MNTAAAAAVSRITVVVVALVACGPSSKQLAVARDARYATDPGALFQIAQDAALASYHKIGQADAIKGAFITLGKWYSPEGTSESAGVGDVVKVEDGSLYVQLLVEVERVDEETVMVKVTPVVERFRLGQAQHDQLRPDDPSLPGWVQGKADTLAFAIYERAKQYVVPAAGASAAPAPAQ